MILAALNVLESAATPAESCSDPNCQLYAQAFCDNPSCMMTPLAVGLCGNPSCTGG
jgi:hypothetical protein